MNKQRQSGFTLVEIAIVLVIIGLLLGGILKGQELINSARVRNLADQNSGIQAAYYGFIDRYRKVPGDWAADEAEDAIGVTINGGGTTNANDGQLNVGDWEEAAAVWEQLAKAGFIQGSYDSGAGSPPTNAADWRSPNIAPVNAFSGYLLLARNSDYSDAGTPSDRLNLHLGDNIPVNIARELDVKVDDGLPRSGVLREAGQPAAPDLAGINESTSPDCQDSSTPPIYDIATDAQNCNLAFLY